ncbi:MAG: D-2-hydroxyacid dehydrogenase [Armatimonadota bacterium]
MPKLVVLDGYVLNPGDLSWDGLAQLGDLTVYDRTPPELVIERASGAEIIFTNKTILSADTISKLPDLKYIGVLATGYNVVDMEAAAQHGVTVTNVPAYSTPSVAQMVFALLLELCNHVQCHSDAVHQGEWASSPDFAFWKTPLIELSGMTIGIIGMGNIGMQVAQIASAMGMKVIAASRSRKRQPDIADFEWVELPDLFSRSDVITIHAPLTPETQGLISRDNIDRMKTSAFLINTGRGPIVVEQDLADALNSGRIAGAGLDVLSVEPPKPDNPLLTAKNCIITPHIAWATLAARSRLMDTVVKNTEAFLNGSPVNIVS